MLQIQLCYCNATAHIQAAIAQNFQYNIHMLGVAQKVGGSIPVYPRLPKCPWASYWTPIAPNVWQRKTLHMDALYECVREWVKLYCKKLCGHQDLEKNHIDTIYMKL